VRCSLQGLTVQTQQYGTLPLFDPVIGWLDVPADRAACYDVKARAGDTHVNLALSGQYAEPGQAYANIPGRDFSSADGLQALRALITEIIQAGVAQGLPNGFRVLLMLAGDGESTTSGPPWSYNDPAGMTYGRAWLMQNFERVWLALKAEPDLTPWILPCPGYDGVAADGGWAGQPGGYHYPSSIDDWLLLARRVIGSKAGLALELAAGWAHWGGESANYTSPAGQGLDVVLSEFPVPMGPPKPFQNEAPWNQVYQIVDRLNRPWNRPADLPPDYDPNPPYYLGPGTPRGPFVYIGWEIDTYLWVRNAISLAEVHAHRQVLHSLGVAVTG
jgi:hypothetical protein